jgi:hypothetical protein
MDHWKQNTLGVLFLLLWFAPLGAGLLDAGCWFFTVSQCTAIPWSEGGHSRVFLAGIWTIVFPLVVVFVGAIGN